MCMKIYYEKEHMKLTAQSLAFLLTFVLVGACLITPMVGLADEAAPDSFAEIRFRAGDYAKALPLYEEQLAASPDAQVRAHALFQIGQCQTGLQKYKEAVQAFDQLLSFFPTSSSAAAALLRKGCLQAGVLKQTKEGLATWETLIEKYPRSPLVPETRFYMGMVEWVQGHKQAAREIWQVLERNYPQHPRTAMAKLYLQKGKS